MTRPNQRETRMAGKRERKRIKLGVAALGLALLVVVGWVVSSVAYNNGLSDGKSEQKAETSEDLRKLGEAIEEKTQALTKLSDLNTETPEQIDSEEIEKYREKLGEIVGSVENEAAKAALEEYAGVWESLAETYASEDNLAIASALEELRSKASDTAIAVTEAYNRKITEAAEKLPE